MKYIKLSNNLKLRIELIGLYSYSLFLRLWINVVHEFRGATIIWSKTLDVLLDDKPDNEGIEYKKALRFIKYHLFKDYSHESLYPNRPFFLAQIYTVLSIFGDNKMTRYFPLDFRIKSTDHTSENEYKKEKLQYKLCHRVASEGRDLKNHFYEEYKYIANKYNWPFIVNSDDPEY